MILEWFNAREVTEVGVALADQFAPPPLNSASPRQHIARIDQDKAMQEILERVDREVLTLQLNFYKKAKFANSFKWRLLENGVQKEMAEEITQRMVLRLSKNAKPGASRDSDAQPSNPRLTNNPKYLLNQANKCIAQGDYAQAVGFYQDFTSSHPRHADVQNNLGAALCKLGRFDEAENCFRLAINANPNLAEAHGNLGGALRTKGQVAEAESWLRRAIKLKPSYLDARNNLGLTLTFLGRLREAEAQFKKVTKVAPGNSDALFGLGHIAEIEGRFDEAEGMFKRSLAANPKMTGAWAGLVGIRKVTTSDGAWLKDAEKIAASSIAPMEEADMRFAIGKYCDDVGDFEQAFLSYKRGNELLKSVAENYGRNERTRFVDTQMGIYTRETLSQVGSGASASIKPIFVIGMPRSGTSLAEQIIASHPSVKGAGELIFWSKAGREHETAILQGVLQESTRKGLAESYLHTLVAQAGDAARIVDKSTINTDYLGMIHSVFPSARIIYMQRDPIDTCLSCYFQKFAVSLNFTTDLSDLAHYYRQHQRLMAHWRSVLPPGTILDVPYSGLVSDQEGWTRRILDFLGLEWDEKCLEFHTTKRPVVTSSFWQVRQKIYNDSVGRWRNYKKFITPLLALKDS